MSNKWNPYRFNQNKFAPIKFRSIRIGSILICSLIAILIAYYAYPQDFPTISSSGLTWNTTSISNITTEITTEINTLEAKAKALVGINSNSSSSYVSDLTNEFSGELDAIELKIKTFLETNFITSIFFPSSKTNVSTDQLKAVALPITSTPSTAGLTFNTTEDIALFQSIISDSKLLPYLLDPAKFNLILFNAGLLNSITTLNINTLINGNNLLASLWTSYVNKYNLGPIANSVTKINFFNNVILIFTRNALNSQYQLAVNAFTYLSHDQFIDFFHLNTAFVSDVNKRPPPLALPAPVKKSIDWRTKGVLTPVKNQGQCGSCYTFSTAAAIESCHYIASGSLENVSEQQLVDCSGVNPYDNQGCNGGSIDATFDYVISNGIAPLSSYAYSGVAGTCNNNVPKSKVVVKSYEYVNKGDTNDLYTKLLKGPVSVGIDASVSDFQSYASGIYNPTGCSSTNLDHAVLVVGWNGEGPTPYWIVRNSWDTTWGIGGYFYLADHDNLCGIATQATLPVC
jgi:cathepsin L